jgi:PAS domain S-box-containing protein
MPPSVHDSQLAATVMGAMPVALTRCSADLRYLWASERYAAWLGLRQEDIIGKPISDVIGSDAMSSIRPHVQAVLAGQRVEYEELVRFNAIGQRWIHAEYEPTFDVSGAVDGWVACIIDLTDRKRAEHGLAVAHTSLERLFELSVMPGGDQAMPALLQAVVDTAIEVTDANMGNLQLFDEATGSLRIAAQRGFERPFLEHFAVVKGGDAACGEAMRRREQVIVEDVSKSPLFDAATMEVVKAAGIGAVQSSLMVSREGALLGVISTHWRRPHSPDRDRLRTLEIVARQAADMIQHRRQEERLREADRRKDEFMAMLGHELRNPLGPILLSTQMMARRGVGAAEKQRQVIERQARHLTRLVDDLLDVSRITRGKIDLRKERVELGTVVAKAVEMAAPLLEQRSQKLTVDVARVIVKADPERLGQVITNLLTNAATYTDPGGKIAVVATATESAVSLRVIDSGAGISPTMLPHVFDLFVQEKQALDRPRGGLGLGLAIVRSLVELHGGQVSARSDGLGKGSEFEISLPRTPVESNGLEATQRGEGPAAGHSRGSRILVVDDNEDGAMSLADALIDMGHEVRVALDGPTALRIAEDFIPVLALIDIGLPGMDGYQLAGRFREVRSLAGVRLVAVTGYGQESDRRRVLAAGFEAHLVKPVDLEVLTRVVGGCSTSERPEGAAEADDHGEGDRRADDRHRGDVPVALAVVAAADRE